MSDIVFVPGRVNIIGEHTDYNDGLSLAFAVDRGVRIEVSNRSDRSTWLHLEGQEPYELGEPHVTNLSFKMANAAWRRYPSHGVNLRVTSDLPEGAGMSSSAAYIGALCLALGARGSVIELARLVQSIEADVGSDVGLLDQITTLGGTNASALLIDFSQNQFEPVTLPTHWAFTVVHSETSRVLAESGYAERRRECEEVSRMLGSWANLTTAVLDGIPVHLRPRVRHVLTENQRVRDFVDCTQVDDVQRAGQLLNESHASLRDDFAVSTPAMDSLVTRTQALPGVHGARMMGGGFGGCIISLHDPEIPVAIEGHRTWSVRPSDGGLRRLLP